MTLFLLSATARAYEIPLESSTIGKLYETNSEWFLLFVVDFCLYLSTNPLLPLLPLPPLHPVTSFNPLCSISSFLLEFAKSSNTATPTKSNFQALHSDKRPHTDKMGGWGADDGAAGWENAGDIATYNDENANPSGNFKDDGFGGNAWENTSAGNEQNDDNKCRNCGSDGHFARNCPEPRKGMACFNCGEEGHSKAECTKPRVFKGTCRVCNQEGHPASQCPERPPDVCKNCKMEGHRTIDCKENRKFDLNNVPDKLPEEAWAAMQKASEEKDLEDFREALKIYSKAVPDATFVDIENKMRQDNLNFYLIAMEKPVGDCISVINLQGKLDCKYVVGFYYSPKPQRANLKERWPESVEENLERLEDAGIPYDREIPKCSNCGEMGHTARGCKEEHVVHERVEVKCVNCSAVGHRARDCTEPRRDRFACRNCGSSEHKAAECPNPRSAEGVECKRCNEVGHFAKDCPQAPAPRTCRNCG
ncbi:hypothetical protein AFCA_000265 [Aspergillus flavus]|nr:hypothetical protein AFCA_000265 [Aspergillus flavus]